MLCCIMDLTILVNFRFSSAICYKNRLTFSDECVDILSYELLDIQRQTSQGKPPNQRWYSFDYGSLVSVTVCAACGWKYVLTLYPSLLIK